MRTAACSTGSSIPTAARSSNAATARAVSPLSCTRARRNWAASSRWEAPAAPCMPACGDDGMVSVDMGVPDFDPRALPMEAQPRRSGRDATRSSVDGANVEIGAVSMGNPHAVLRVPDVETAPVERFGPSIETSPALSEADQRGLHADRGSRSHPLARVRARRGRDPGLRHGRLRRGRRRPALGTARRGRASRSARRHARWFLGRSRLRHVWLTGPATTVFTGSIDI